MVESPAVVFDIEGVELRVDFIQVEVVIIFISSVAVDVLEGVELGTEVASFPIPSSIYLRKFIFQYTNRFRAIRHLNQLILFNSNKRKRGVLVVY
ncbi:hypothetical protein ACFQU5_16490 [Ureibacillus sp. GCM10028918]